MAAHMSTPLGNALGLRRPHSGREFASRAWGCQAPPRLAGVNNASISGWRSNKLVSCPPSRRRSPLSPKPAKKPIPDRRPNALKPKLANG